MNPRRTEPPVPPSIPSPLNGVVSGYTPGGLFRSSPFGQALSAYLPATALIRLINFARVLLLIWWMTQHQFGLLNIILLAINVLTPLCSLGLFEAVTRYVPQYEVAGTLLAFIRRSLFMLLVTSAMGVTIIVCFAPQLGDFLFAQELAQEHVEDLPTYVPRLTQLTAAVTALLIVYFYLVSVLKGLRMFVALSVVETTHSLLFLAGSTAAWFSDHLSAFTLTAIYGASLALPILYFGLRLARLLAQWTSQDGAISTDSFYGKLLRFSLWTTLAGFTWQILIYYPVWYLNKTNGPEAVAVFSAVRQIGQFIMVGAVAVSTVVMTTVTKTWESQGRSAAEHQLSLGFRCAGLGLLLLCGIGALAKNLIIRMFRPEYASGADILPLQFLFFLIGAYLAFLPAHFQLIETTRNIFWPWAIGIATNVLMAFWLSGNNLVQIQKGGWWQALVPATSAIFSTGFSDHQGLGAASWCGAAAIACALAVCVLLIRAERCRLDRGTYALIGAALLLPTKPWILAIGLALLFLMAWRTEWIFTVAERTVLADHVRTMPQQIARLLGRHHKAHEGGH